MASLDEAYERQGHPHNTVLDPNTVAYAYGPKYSSGLSARGVYNVTRDPQTKRLYIENKKEYLEEDGSVVGNEDKSYRIRWR